MRWITGFLGALLLAALAAQPAAAVVITTNWGYSDAPHFATPAMFMDVFLTHENGTVYRCNTGAYGACNVDIPPGTIERCQAYNEDNLIASFPTRKNKVISAKTEQEGEKEEWTNMLGYVVRLDLVHKLWNKVTRHTTLEEARAMGLNWSEYLFLKDRALDRFFKIKTNWEIAQEMGYTREQFLEVERKNQEHYAKIRRQEEEDAEEHATWTGAPGGVIKIFGFYFPLPVPENAGNGDGDGNGD